MKKLWQKDIDSTTTKIIIKTLFLRNIYQKNYLLEFIYQKHVNTQHSISGRKKKKRKKKNIL